MHIAHHRDKRIDIRQLSRLAAQADWMQGRSETDLARMVERSQVVVGAWEGEQLVGFARALTDGLYRALIEDVVVDEAHRGELIGSALIEALLGSVAGVEDVRLGCRPELVPWYRTFGFEPAPGAILRLVRPRPG